MPNLPQYVPNISGLPEVVFRPYMIETAWNYCDAVIKSDNKCSLVGDTLAALAIEIALKSFSAITVENEGKLTEKYEFKPVEKLSPKQSHNLLYLANTLPEKIRCYLFNPSGEDALKEHQDTFSEHRYAYETKAPFATSDELIELAIEVICLVIFLYKQRGCKDPFIMNFDINKIFFTHVQRMLL